ncbi:MAG TPA: CoA transferase [Bradyrhizobium sp.]|jgi:crotonobetainyl-CoA:carnitine CoA-transferase CaiB-like acyl-CoA transferase|uniref:CaiB/BaiF CoA transferase family protein n=1 Tax=Bradyrhizobium sp. TaxID=376 RepID=UPI002C15B841|nr:CoA transferase [Bradyrhizobium sp.]HTB00356.1 CoA transferase [Bradyrhizobium sp.]
MSTQELPLSGVRVVEMTHMVMGPTCGMILAQLGAEVIKVEPPSGDKTRDLGGMGTAFFPLFNRGKRSVLLDFTKPDDRATMDRLLASADVFLENFRDGQLEKQGLGADELRRRHPHLIVCGHKGFLSGPYEHRPALDEVVQMMSGLAAMTGTQEKPQRVGSSANDIMGGMFGVISILAALYQKRGAKAADKTGADIRIGLFENCLFLVAQHMVEFEMTGNRPRSMPEREHAWPIYDIFETQGGERIFIGVVTEGHWQSFCREFGMQEFLDDPGLRTTTDRILARSKILPRVAEIIRGWNAAELSAVLDRLNICFSPINRPEDLFDDPHVLRPGGLVNNFDANGAPFRVPALPIEWNGANIGEGLKVPVLGADTEAVRAELKAEEFPATAKTAARLA